MNDIELVILHGPPASGKSTLAQEMSYILKEHDVTHAFIDMDYLAKVHPRTFIGIQYKNLTAIWPNYVQMGSVKMIVVTYLQKGELEKVMKAAPAKSTKVYEVVAPTDVLRQRITTRTADIAQQQRHLELVKGYAANGPLSAQIDYSLVNANQSVRESALEVLKKLDWL